MSINEQLNKILGDLRSSIPEIKGAVVASSDGMAIASNLSSSDPNRMAAMVATALGLAKRICETMSCGVLTETSVVGNQGLVFVYAAGSKGVLSVMAAANANVGLINLECRAAASNIQGVLG
jgi:predicted regulator of Ras-like GTPase activity (Roadblock/LC7/MglB family)